MPLPQFQLRETESRPVSEASASPTVQADTLSSNDAERLLALLPPATEKTSTESTQQKTFSRQTDIDSTLERPMPVTGDARQLPSSSDSGEIREKEIIGFGPQGCVPAARQVTVTFGSDVGQLGEMIGESPATLHPPVPGRWRWLDRRVLAFEPDSEELPRSTRYEVQIAPALLGLGAEAFAWSFETQAPKLVGHGPGKDQATDLTPVIHLSFDQSVDAEHIFDRLVVKPESGEPVRLRRVSDEEAARSYYVRRERRRGYHTLAAVPDAPLQRDTRYHVSLPSIACAVEGDLPSKACGFSFKTFPPLKILPEKEQRGYHDGAMVIQFNNQLDENAFDPSSIRIDPPVDASAIDFQYDRIHIGGPPAIPLGTYEITLPASLKDEFGNELGESQTVIRRMTKQRRFINVPWSGYQLPPHTVSPAHLEAVAFDAGGLDSVMMTVWKVKPEDWSAFEKYRSTNKPSDKQIPGERICSEQVRIGKEKASVRVTVPVAGALDDGFGHAIVQVKSRGKAGEHAINHTGWIQVTELGVTVVEDNEHLLARVTQLPNPDDDPIALTDVDVRFADDSIQARTDASGFAELEKPPEDAATPKAIHVRRGSDCAIVPFLRYSLSARREEKPIQVLWWMVCDRELYRPGDQVAIKGLIRTREQVAGSGLRRLPKKRAKWQLWDSQRDVRAEGNVIIEPVDGFDFCVDLPTDMPLGHANIEIRINGWGDGLADRSHSLPVRVMEFRRPDFDLTLTASVDEVVFGDSIDWTARARYFGGGVPSGLVCKWEATCESIVHTPPGNSEYGFGSVADVWLPEWHDEEDDEELSVRERHESAQERRIQTVLDGDGVSRVTCSPIDSTNEVVAAHRLSVEVAANDVDRQEQSADATILIHPASVYVGLRPHTWFVGKGEQITVSWITVDPQGKSAPGCRLNFRLRKRTRQQQRGVWKSTYEVIEERELEGDSHSGQVDFVAREAGDFQLEAIVTDQQGRRQRSETSLWVTGRGARFQAMYEHQSMRIQPDKDSYSPGDIAKLLILTSFESATGFAIVRASGILHRELITVEQGSAQIEVPLEQSMCPEVTVQVELIGRVDDEHLPVDAISHSHRIAIDSSDFRLPLSVAAEPEVVRPGESTSVSVHVDRLREGQPSGFAMMVVDEAMLSVSDYEWPEILGMFYRHRYEKLQSTDTRAHWIRPLVKEVGSFGYAACMAGGAGGSADASVLFGSIFGNDDEPGDGDTKLRSDFRPLAQFVATGELDADGNATVSVELPDTVTTYRVMVAAWSGDDRIGDGQASLQTRQPIVVRPSLPRQLSVGDQVQLSAVIQNQNPHRMRVHVVARATNLELDDAGVSVVVEAESLAEVRFPATAATCGKATLALLAVTEDGSCRDAVTAEIPVHPAVTSNVVATYGQLEASDPASVTSCPIEMPPDGATDSQVRLGIAASVIDKIANLVVVLKDYDFDCVEQIASRIIGYVTGQSLVTEFRPGDAPHPARVAAQLRSDLKRLVDLQNDTGGFAFWERRRPSVPIVTLRVAHAIAATRQNVESFGADPDVLGHCNTIHHAMSDGYLAKMEKRIPKWYDTQSRQHLRAYAFHLQHRLATGDEERQRVAEQAKTWMNSQVQLGPEASALLLPAFANSAEPILRQVLSCVDQTSAGATLAIAADHADGHLALQSRRTSDAMLLYGLLQCEPGHPLVTKLARQLLESKTGRRLSATYESGWVLDALASFLRLRETASPDMRVFAWLSETNENAPAVQCLGKPIRDRVTEAAARVPLDTHGDQTITVAAEGTGVAYWTAELRYDTPAATTSSLDQGFRVRRTLYDVADGHVIEPDAEGRYHLVPGRNVACEVQFVAPSVRHHVALVSPMPACCESLPPQKPDRRQSDEPLRWWLRRHWYDHVQERDDRVEAFTQQLDAGVHTLKHIMQVTAHGTFLWPAAWCEEMYRPETFGRCDAASVSVT